MASALPYLLHISAAGCNSRAGENAKEREEGVSDVVVKCLLLCMQTRLRVVVNTGY